MKSLQCYLVGGAVRDELLGLPVVDRDWVVVGASSSQMLALGFTQVGRDFPVFLHPRDKEEYALARTERKRGPGHTGFSVDANPSVTLTEDLRRRDLTINAMARNDAGELIDPFNGLQDIQNRVLRHVSEAFVEDPLRVFRVARFAAGMPDFSVADSTIELMRKLCGSPDILALSAERVWQEFAKALSHPAAGRFFQVLSACAGMSPWFAELRDKQIEFPRTDLNARQRFALLPLDAAALLALSKRLKAPRTFVQDAQDYQQFADAVRHWSSLSAEDCCDLLLALKANHDPQRLQRLVALLALIEPEREQYLQDLLGLAAAFKDVRLAPPAADQVGAAYGRALRTARVNWLAQRLR